MPDLRDFLPWRQTSRPLPLVHIRPELLTAVETIAAQENLPVGAVVNDLLLAQRLSRPVAEYTTPSPAARAAAQLQAAGKERYPGQRIRFVLTRGEPDVYAWGLPRPLDPARVDVARYETLTLRAVQTVLQPWGVSPGLLAEGLAGGWRQCRLPLGYKTAGKPAG